MIKWCVQYQNDPRRIRVQEGIEELEEAIETLIHDSTKDEVRPV